MGSEGNVVGYKGFGVSNNSYTKAEDSSGCPMPDAAMPPCAAKPPRHNRYVIRLIQALSCRLKFIRTSLLLLHGQLLPVNLHAIPKRHPEIGLLLRGHVFPSLLDVGEGRVGDGVGLANLLLLQAGNGASGRSANSLTSRR